MTKEEKLRYLNEVIYALKAAGIIRKQSDLANLMGIYPTSLSCAKAGGRIISPTPSSEDSRT